MSTEEDEALPSLNERLRPRKSTSTTTPSPQKPIRRAESRPAQDRPKRVSSSSKASPSKQHDLVTKSDPAPASMFLCPYCDKKFNAKQTASTHSRRIHLSTTKQDNFIKCLYCNHSDAEPYAIIKHMVDSHSNQYFACLDCHTRFTSTTELAEHRLNVCEKQKPPYRSKLRQKSSPEIKKKPKKTSKSGSDGDANENKKAHDNIGFSGIVISCELKPSEMHDAADIEDKITTNVILPSTKSLGKSGMDKNAVIVLDELHWNKRIPPNFSFHNTDADQILSRLGVVHRSPRVGESRKDLAKMMDEPNQKFEKCFDTSFYSKVAKNVQENLAKYLDGTFNFIPNKDSTIKTRKSKASVIINTAEGFPILLAQEQFSRNLFDGFIPRALAPKHKWKWDSAENDKNLIMLLDQTKRDSHVNNCIITLISSLDIWTQLRMKSKFENKFKATSTAKKTEKQNIIGMELKEILESRDIPASSLQVVQCKRKPVDVNAGLELPSYLGLSATKTECELQPAVLSGEWVRPRCYVCCACGEQTRDARTLTSHLTTRHPNAQVQHYEIVGETLLSADILKHLYVPPSQISNRTRPPRGFRDCTKCKKSVTLEDLHQHMLDCAGDTPAVRRKCRYRPFGVRRRRTRLPDNTIRKKMRKDIRSRHRQKTHMRPRPRIRTEVGDAETIRRMIADLPAKRNRITSANVLRPRRTILQAKQQAKIRSAEGKQFEQRPTQFSKKSKKSEIDRNDTDNSSTLDEDDQPLKLSVSRVSTRSGKCLGSSRNRVTINKKKKPIHKDKTKMEGFPPIFYNYGTPSDPVINLHDPNTYRSHNVVRPEAVRPDIYQASYQSGFCPNQTNEMQGQHLTGIFQMEVRENELLDQIKSNHSASFGGENSDQRIDVTNAGTSYMRNHSNRTHNDNYMRSRGDGPLDGRDSSNQNNNVAQVPHVPLKHSIANITNESEAHDSSASYQHPHIISSDMKTSYGFESTDNRNQFENEAMVEKVHKPPLSHNSGQSQLFVEQRPTLDRPYNIYQQHSYPYHPIVETDSNITVLSNMPIEFRTRVGPVDDSKAIEKFAERLPPLINSKESHELVGEPHLIDLQQSRPYVNAEQKVETDKSKCTKSRKGLKIENCIAMLRTKKGFRLEKVASVKDVNTADSENKYIEDIHHITNESKIPSNVTTTFQKSNDSADGVNVAIAYDKYPQSENLGQNRSHSISPNQRSFQIETHLPKNMHRDSEDIMIDPQSEAISESHVSSSGRVDSDKTTVLTRVESSQIKPCTDIQRSIQTRNFEYELTTLHNFWRHLFYEIQNPERYYHSQTIQDTIKSLKQLDFPYLNRALKELQLLLTKGTEEISLHKIYEFSFRCVYEEYEVPIPLENALVKERANEQDISTNERVSAKMTNPVVASSFNTDDETGENLSSRQNNLSPNPRRTRRKPIKIKTHLAKPDSNTEPNILAKHSIASPLQHESSRLEAKPLNTNTFSPSSKNLPPSPMTLHLPSTPIPSNSVCVRRESSKRSPNNSDTYADNKNIMSQPKAIITSTAVKEVRTENEEHIFLNNLRRRSIELSNVQNKFANIHSRTAQAYRLQYENALMNISLAGGDLTHFFQNIPEECIKDNLCYSNSKEQQVNRFSAPTLLQMNQNTHGAKPLKPKISCEPVNKSNSHKSCGHYKQNQDSEQHPSAYKQKSDNLDSNTSQARDVTEKKYSNQETKVNVQKCNVQDSNLHQTTPRRSSELSYGHPSKCPSNVRSERTFDMGSIENRKTPDNSSRAHYLEPVAMFVAPSTTRPKNIYNPHSAVSSLPHVPITEDVVPLDLSCVSRKENPLEEMEIATDLSKKNLDTLSDKEIKAVLPTSGQFYKNELRNPYSLNKEFVLEPEPVDEISHQLAPTTKNSAINANNKDNFMTKQIDLSLNNTSLLTDNSSISSKNDEPTNIFTTDGNAINKLTEHDTTSPAFNVSKHINDNYIRECAKDKTFAENKKNSSSELQISPIPKGDDKMVTKHITSLSAGNVTSIAHEDNHNTKIPSNIPDSKQINQTTNLCGQDASSHDSQIDQDAETARKIALLPEELVRILGTIPKDHRNQLINVLPQYVSTPVSNTENDIKSSSAHKNSAPHLESNSTTCSDSNLRLSVNTISPSSVIPKKRHTPSQSKGRLNSSEAMSYEPLLPGTFSAKNSQNLPITQKDSQELSQTGNLIEEKNLENIVVCHPELAIQNISKNNGDNVKTNSTNEYRRLNKNEEGSISTAFIPTISAQNVMNNSAQNLLTNLCTRQKNSNEQTASLRAVRIKTTSARKSFSDDKKLVVNYGTNTNTSVDEIHKNPLQTTVYRDYKNKPDSKHTEIHSQDIKNNAGVTVPEKSSLGFDCIDVGIKTNLCYKNFVREHDNDIISQIPLPKTQYNENQDDRSCERTEQSSASVNNDSFKMSDSITEVETSTPKSNVTAINNDSHEKSNTSLEMYPPGEDINKTKSTIDMKPEIHKHSENNADKITANDSPNNKEFQLSMSIEVDDAKQFIGSKDTFEKHASSITPQLTDAKEKTLKSKRSHEDDSEDDETLAVIKQKHCSQPIVIETNTSSKETVEQPSKLKNTIKMKKAPKRKKGKLPKKSKVMPQQHNIQNKDTEKVLETLPASVVIPSEKNRIENNMCDINKENNVTKNVNLTKDNSDSQNQISGNSHIECVQENSHDENVCHLSTETNLNTSDKNVPLCKNDEVSLEEIQLQNENVSGIMKCNLDSEGKDKSYEITEVSFSDSIDETPSRVSSTRSDFELCTEIPETNVQPLRRSRRGKSMYVNNIYLEDETKIEEHIKKTPLTMKRLILSRVEKDRISESSLADKPENTGDDTLSIVSEEAELPVVKKRKLTKGKNSPLSRRSYKKTKRTGASDLEDGILDINNITSENKSLILRELPNAGNKINDNISGKDDVKYRVTTDHNLSSTEITTKLAVEFDTEFNISEAKETVNDANLSEIDSKSKHLKNKSQSDFDSDDEKALLVTKQKIVSTSNQTGQDNSSNRLKEDNDLMKCDQMSSDIKSKFDELKPTVNVALPAQIRTTCYNRPISNRRSRSSSVLSKDNANHEIYDPYDIDLDDTDFETTPIIKKKSKKSNKSQSTKLFRDQKLLRKEDPKSTVTKTSKQTVAKNVSSGLDRTESKDKYSDDKQVLKSKSKHTNDDQSTELYYNPKLIGQDIDGTVEKASKPIESRTLKVNETNQRKDDFEVVVNLFKDKLNSAKTVAKTDSNETISNEELDKDVSNLEVIKEQNKNVCKTQSTVIDREHKQPRIDDTKTSKLAVINTVSNDLVENKGHNKDSEDLPAIKKRSKRSQVTQLYNDLGNEGVNNSAFEAKKAESTKELRMNETDQTEESGYDIDFIVDILYEKLNRETRETVSKTRSDNKVECESHDKKVIQNFDDLSIMKKNKNKCKTQNTKSSDRKLLRTEDLSSTHIKALKPTVSKTLNDETDSDSSKSDVPLQKYVEEKALEFDSKCKNNEDISHETSFVEKRKVSNEDYHDTQHTFNATENIDSDEKSFDNDANVEFCTPSYKSSKSSKRIVIDIEDEATTKRESLNSGNITADEMKQKKSRRASTSFSDNPVNVSADVDQQLKSDKFMENFGFYSEKIPRKSNLLATKKISETFHMISNESDDYFFSYKEKTPRKTTTSENKKSCVTTFDITALQDSTKLLSGEITNTCSGSAQITESRPDIDENIHASESDEALKMDDSDLDSLTAQAIMDSEEVRNLENDLFSGLREAAEANARNYFVGYQNTNAVGAGLEEIVQNNSIFETKEDSHKSEQTVESSKKSSKIIKHNKEASSKNKMYPDIEEIDMFEDKFDKIKRKRRSQAVAAKQVQVTVDSRTSSKSRKQTEKKKNAKSSKKNYQNAHVPTKGALKGFENTSIKISIPTQDLNLPINVSPPRQSKKRRKTSTKRRKEASDSDSSGSEFDDKDISGLEKDIYDFQDSDAELFDLRPSTVMDRFRSMNNKNKSKIRDKEKTKDTEKIRGKERKADVIDRKLINLETKAEKDIANDFEKGLKKFSRDGGRVSNKVTDYFEKSSPTADKDTRSNENFSLADTTKIQKSSSDLLQGQDYDIGKKNSDVLTDIAGTSGFVPDRMDESDYESGLSSPEGEFIFYTSNDTNCTCPSEIDSDDSDVERGCGRLNCVHRNRNTDKKTAIGNIFKNNAVRCEKPEIKEPDKPKINLDQLFDSLLETESKPTNTVDNQKDGSSIKLCETDIPGSISISVSTGTHPNLSQTNKKGDALHESKSTSLLFESNDYDCLKMTPPSSHTYEIKNSLPKSSTPLLTQNETDSDTMHLFPSDSRSNDDFVSIMSEDSTRANLTHNFADDNNKPIDKKSQSTKIGTTIKLKNDNSDNEPASLHKQHMQLILPAETASTCAQSDSKIDHNESESGNESAASKYLKGLSPSEAANMEIYTMVSAQGTQTDKSNRRDITYSDFTSSKSEDESHKLAVPRSRIRLQKYDVREIAHKSKSTKSIQTEKDNSDKLELDDQLLSDDDDIIGKHRNRSKKRTDLDKGNGKNVETSEKVSTFTVPSSRSLAEKQARRKSDEGINTSHEDKTSNPKRRIRMPKSKSIIPEKYETYKAYEFKSHSNSEDDVDLKKYRNRLRKNSDADKSIVPEKDETSKAYEFKSHSNSEDEVDLKKYRNRIRKNSFSDKSHLKSRRKDIANEEEDMPGDREAFTALASRSSAEKQLPRKSDEGISTSHDQSADAFFQPLPEWGDTGVASQRARRKCTVGKQNVLAEHWSSESEIDGRPARPNSADSIVASAPRRKKSRKKEAQHSGGRKGNRHSSSKGGARGRGRSEDSDAGTGSCRPPPGPKIRARAAHHYWSSEGEDTVGPQPQHGWIVGDSHKKLVTMLAHAKGRKRTHAEKHLD